MAKQDQAKQHVPPPPEPTRPLEGLSGMGARIGRVPKGNDQIDHAARQGLRREEQQQIEEGLERQGRRDSPDMSSERLMNEPHEDKGTGR